MKILICSEFYPPHVGGVEEHSFQLAQYLNKKGNQVEIATTYLSKREINKGLIKVNQFKIKGNFVRGYSGDVTKYQQFLLSSNFDVIFVNAAQQWSLDLLLPLIKDLKSKKIFFPCGFSKLNNYFYKPYFFYLKKYLDSFDKIICVSRDFKDFKFIKKYYNKKIHIIENGSSINKPIYSRKKFRKKYNLNKNDKIITNISNIKFFKGQDRSIVIFNKMESLNLKLFIIGKNFSSLYYLFLKIKILIFNYKNTKKKILLLDIPRNESLTILQYSNVFLFTSRLEYDPLVIKEAILSSVKFVSYNVGIINKYAKKKFGFCGTTHEELIKKLNQYIKFKHQKKRNIQIYNWRNILPKYYKLFKFL
jgi:L-malate glycosyltransferase